MVLITEYYSDDQIKQDQKGGSRSMNDSRERRRRHFCWEKTEGKISLKYVSVGGIIILKLI